MPDAPASTVPVLLPLPLAGPLDYRADADIPPGSFVAVGLGPRRVIGVVWDGAAGEVPAERLKPVIEVLPAPPRRVCALAAAGLAALAGAKLTPARRRVLETLRDGGAAAVAEIARRAGCGAGVVRGLIAAGLAEETLVPAAPPAPPAPACEAARLGLSPDQARAAAELTAQVAAGGFGVTLLDGVTGAGKTETYFAAIAAALAAGKQVLVLLPEIALGAQWLDRFRRRFA